MTRPTVTPVRVAEQPPFDGWREDHPSYGIIGLSRVSGHTRLFGSRVPLHHDFIILRVHRATRRFSFCTERASANEQVIEVALSSVQFARMLTEMNMGDGVPCTLRRVGREEMPEVPDAPVELVEARIEAAERVASIRGKVAQRVDELRAKLSGKVSAKLFAEVEAVLQGFVTEVASSIPFYQKQVDEAAERAAAAASAEVDAYITGAVTRVGLAALQDADVTRKLLGGGGS